MTPRTTASSARSPALATLFVPGAVALVGLQVLFVLFLPLLVPLLPVDRLIAYQQRLGLALPASEKAHARAALPQHLAKRLLDVQGVSHDCSIGEHGFHAFQRPRVVGDQGAPALRFGDERVRTLLHALVRFRLLPNGFSNRDLRRRLEPLRGRRTTPGAVTYDLRRLRLRGFIRRIPRTHRYEVTEQGLRYVLFFTRSYALWRRMTKPADPSSPPGLTLLGVTASRRLRTDPPRRDEPSSHLRPRRRATEPVGKALRAGRAEA